jgi:hypothetical protein
MYQGAVGIPVVAKKRNLEMKSLLIVLGFV